MGECNVPLNGSTNLTDNTNIEDLNFVAYGIISPLIIGLGIFGDLMTIFVLTHPLLRRASIIYTYLTALAFTDLLALVSILPMIFTLIGNKSCSYSAAFYYAHLGFPLANALMSTSVWIVTFLTLAQYVAICHPFVRSFRSRSLAAALSGTLPPLHSAAFYYAHLGFPLANALMSTSVWIVTFLTLAQYVAICHPFVRSFRSRSLAAALSGTLPPLHSAAFYYAHLGFPLANALMFTSVWIVTFLTLAQYVAICHPFVRSFRSRSLAAALSGVSYALSFLLHIPWSFKKTVVELGPDASCPFVACDISKTIPLWYKVMSYCRESVCRIIPFILLFYFNLRILITYRRTKRERLNRRGMLEEKGEREERRLWQLLLGIVSIFFICTIPAAPFTVYVSDKLETHFWFQLFRAITNVLEFTKFTLNFYFYCMVNPDIRTLAMKRLTCQTITKPAMQGGNNVQLSSIINGRPSTKARGALTRGESEPFSKRSQSLPPTKSRTTSLELAASRQARLNSAQERTEGGSRAGGRSETVALLSSSHDPFTPINEELLI